jgi:hypothetical protein
MATLGYMADLANGSAAWHTPSALGSTTDSLAFLPYWIGAGMLLLAPAGLTPDFAVRIPFILLLGLAMVATWYGTYCLARSPRAQPVAFAFGGEAMPKDYARALADGGLLAFISCLGLAQLAHESTPALAQLSFAALYFYAIAALPYRRYTPTLAAIAGQLGLTLSGAPALALLFGLGSAAIHYLDRSLQSEPSSAPSEKKRRALQTCAIVALTVIAAATAYAFNLWRWKIVTPASMGAEFQDLSQLLVWFIWPAWPLALWTLWIWRKHLCSREISRHLTWPGFLVCAVLVATFATDSSDRTLLLALPALAPLAAFALPTLKRQVSALVDWFTLLFFSGCGIIIWVVWCAMLTGFPSQPAANVLRLAPGFTHTFSMLAVTTALLATLAWAYLVRWRVGKHRSVIWKSLALPAGGAALCWVLLMTLWLPLLDYTQSYLPLVQRTAHIIKSPNCIQTQRIAQDIQAALQWYGHFPLQTASEASGSTQCQWLLAQPAADLKLPADIDLAVWQPLQVVQHPADTKKSFWILQRQ